MQTTTSYKHPLTWVPSGYFTMALTYNLLTAAAVILFSNLGMDNGKAAAYASMLGIAYTVKPFFAAFLEMYKSKKFFVLTTQLAQAVGYFAIAAIMHLPNYLTWMMGLFWVLSFIGSTQDITSDGVYVTSLDAKTQAKFCGVQSLSWNLGKLFMMSVVVASTGYLHQYVFKHDPHVNGSQWVDSWQVIFVGLGIFMVFAAGWHWKFMPEGSRTDHAPKNINEAMTTLGDALTDFFCKKAIWLMIGFALLFRVSYGFLLAPSMLFMKDTTLHGGLLLTNQQFGLIYGTFGLVSNVVGSLIGGFYVAKKGLKKALFPLCCAVNIPNITFLLLAIYRPTDHAVISAGVVVEQLFFGIGSVGFMIYLMQQLAPGRFATAHYAFGTALMALCMILSGIMSGYMQLSLGYVGYFVFVMVATVPSFIICWLAPFHVKHNDDGSVEAPPLASTLPNFEKTKTYLLFSFKGRVGRNKALLYFSLVFLVGLLFTGLSMESVSKSYAETWKIVSEVYWAVMGGIPSLAVLIKRSHDRGRSGWFVLIIILPFLNLLLWTELEVQLLAMVSVWIWGGLSLWFWIECLFVPGTKGNNKYGFDPVGITE